MQIITQPESFEDTPIDVIVMAGEKWVGGPQIGAALGFADPAKAMRKIYARSIREFDETTNIMVELPTAGGRQLVRLYNARGAALIAMKAQTSKGEAFRRWVLDVLEGTADTGPVAPAAGVPPIVLAKLRSMFLGSKGNSALVRYRSMGLGSSEIARLLEVARPSVVSRIRVAEFLGLVAADPKVEQYRQMPQFEKFMSAKRQAEANRAAKLRDRDGNKSLALAGPEAAVLAGETTDGE
jgi:hypothetical protein